MTNRIRITNPTSVRSVSSTLADISGVSASILDSATGPGNQNLILRGIEAGPGISVILQPVNNGNPLPLDQKIVIGLGSNQPITGPFVRKIGDQMTGNLTFANTSGARILAGENSAAQPSYSFLSDQDTGLLRPNNDTLSLVTGGVERLTVRFDGNIVVQGTGQVSLPSGNTSQRPIINQNGSIRHNTDSGFVEARVRNTWRDVVTPIGQPGVGEFLSWTGTDYNWQNVSGSGVVKILDTIAERDALTASLGELVWVKIAHDGEWALYLCTQLAPVVWTEISNFDSSQSDAKTRSITFDYTAASPQVIANVSNNSRVTWVLVEVITPFDDINSVIYVGDQFVNNRLLDTSAVDLQNPAVYVSNPTYVYTGLIQDEPIYCYFNFGVSTSGLVRVTISWQ
jgi:hypothetical protein